MDKHLPFHQQLRRERERRSWSQADVATKLGVDVKTVNRWEHGSRRPFPYYRQLLCQLFEKNAEEFGLFEDLSEESMPSASEASNSQLSLQPVLNTSVEPPSSLSSGLRNEDANTRVFLDYPLRVDWGESPHIGNFLGRIWELTELKKCIIDDQCRMVAILGMGGVGKTTLSSELVGQIKDHFAYVFWRSLQNAPPLEDILEQCIQFVSDQKVVHLPKPLDEQITLLIQYLREHRCLLVIDNVESILQAGERVGHYLGGYENYGTLLQRIGEAQHSSCLLLTSREKPKEIVRLEGKTLPVRSLHLSGVGYVEGQKLLKGKDLVGSQEQWKALINLYSGNPLALKLISESIEGIFGGNIARFLEEEEIAFGDINDFLDQQFQRLSIPEQEILYWLAIEREAASLENIRENFVRPMSKGTLLEALDSLQRRSLVETRGPAQFTLQPVILEYVTNSLTKQAYDEFTGRAESPVKVWLNYALMKAQTKDYVRDSQVRLILGPVAEQLLDTVGKEGIEQKLRSWLSTQRQMQPRQRNYLTGNALNLLIHLHYDLRGSDFSSVVIRQAYLQNVALPNVNFTNAHFEAPVFTNTFGNVHTVAFSPNGELLATGTANGDIWIYQVPTGTPLLTCHGHTDGVWSTTFSFDGHILASSSDDQTIRLWDTRTGQCLKILHGHTNRVWSIAFSSDGRILASGSTDHTIRLWDVSIGHSIKTLQDHTDAVRLVAFSPNGKVLASSSDDQTVRLWDVRTAQCIKVLRGHTNRVWSVAFSFNGQILASGSEDQTVRLWDADSGLCLKVLQNHAQGIRSVAFSSDRQILASGGDDQAVRLWDVGTGYCLKTLQGYTSRIRSIAFSPDGYTLVSAGEDQTIRIWNVSTGHNFYTLQGRGHLVRWVDFSPAGHSFVSGGGDQTVRLWDSSNGRCIYTLQGHTNWVWAVAFSPDGQILASGGEDQTVRLWDAKTGRCLYILRGHTSWVRSVAFSSSERILGSGSDDQTIKLWETNTGSCLNTLEGHISRVRSVAFSPDGQILASGSEDQTIRLWTINNGHCLQILRGHTNWVRSIAFSPDGQMLASGSDDQTIRLWEVSTGRCLQILQGHTDRIRSITFSSNGQVLASGSDDGTIKLWDVQITQCNKTLISERPYEHMNISNVKGLTDAQKITLKMLGAIEDEGQSLF